MKARGTICTRVRRNLLLLVALAELAMTAHAGEWVAYTSDNFTLYSDAREKEAIAVIENFEVFRQTALSVLGLPDMPESERLLILMLEKRQEFSRIRPGPGVGGFFYDSMFGPRMIVGPSGGAQGTQEVLFHEYVHYLVNRYSEFNYPRWYSEGLATLLGTADIDDTSIILGRPAESYSLAISVGADTTVRNVVEADPRMTVGGFYLTSWLMVHYFLLDSTSAATRRGQTLEYLRRFDAGEDPLEAFTASYGVTVDEMQDEITNYTQRRRLTAFRFPRGERGGASTSRRSLDPGEASYLLGNIAVELDQPEAAHFFFDRFDDETDQSPLRTKMMSRRAVAYIHEKKPDEGDKIVEDLVARDITDADVLADIAHYAYDRFVYARDSERDAAEAHLARSIEYGERAAALDPADVETLFYLGLAREAQGNLRLAADSLLSAYKLNRSIPRLNINLARVLIKGQQPAYASYLLTRLYSATHSEDTRAAIRQILQDIEAGDVDIDALDSLL